METNAYSMLIMQSKNHILQTTTRLIIIHCFGEKILTFESGEKKEYFPLFSRRKKTKSERTTTCTWIGFPFCWLNIAEPSNLATESVSINTLHTKIYFMCLEFLPQDISMYQPCNSLHTYIIHTISSVVPNGKSICLIWILLAQKYTTTHNCYLLELSTSWEKVRFLEFLILIYSRRLGIYLMVYF